MDAVAYAVEAKVEAAHWWFVGRRKLFMRELAKRGIGPTARVLDIGTSTGTNLRMLRDGGFRDVSGLDASEEAIRFCASKNLGVVRKGDICDMPFSENSMDLILATDIVEHVDDDLRAVREIHRVLTPGGATLITVPAFQSLWGLQDERAFHKRRYRLPQIRGLVEAAGLVPTRCYYFNYLLFGPIWLARQIIRLANVQVDSEGQINTSLLNAIFSAIFTVDIMTAGVVRPPFGVSILVLATKPESATVDG